MKTLQEMLGNDSTSRQPIQLFSRLKALKDQENLTRDVEESKSDH